MADARFEDTDDGPLRLIAQSAEDLQVLAALVQDAVFPITEMTYAKGQHRFALLLNRFRWEDRADAERERRPYERVRSLLVFENVLAVRSQGIARSDRDVILSVLSIGFAADQTGGTLDLVLAGDGVVQLQIEALDAVLTDVSRPYRAPSGHVPRHSDQISEADDGTA